MYAIRLVMVLFVCLLSQVVKANEPLPIDIGQYEGSVVMVDFWASWCGPCRESFPWLNEMQRKYSDANLKIIGVNVDAEKSDALRFLEKYPNKFEVVYDSKGVLATKYQILGMPSTLIFDRSGNLVSQHHGFKQKKTDDYEKTIRNILSSGVGSIVKDANP